MIENHTLTYFLLLSFISGTNIDDVPELPFRDAHVRTPFSSPIQTMHPGQGLVDEVDPSQ